MKSLRFALCIFIIGLFCSCETTKVYIKTRRLLYEDDFLVSETSNTVQIDYKEKDGETTEETSEIENISKRYYNYPGNSYNLPDTDAKKNIIHKIEVEREKSLKAKDELVYFYLIETADIELSETEETRTETKVLGKKTMRIQDGEIVMSSSNSNKVLFSGSKFPAPDEAAFEIISQGVITQIQNEKNESYENESTVMRTENITEKITVISTSNTNYILYSFLGKPFVILGASAWNVLKCAGYAVINFGGGYNLTSGKGDGSLWKIPSFKASKEKAVIAREANRIKYYPEYHLPFTDNKIIVDKYDKNIEVEKLIGEDAEQITAIEHQEYDNTMSVSLSAKADAASTTATANMVGTVVTIPISVTTWLAGAAYGIYDLFTH